MHWMRSWRRFHARMGCHLCKLCKMSENIWLTYIPLAESVALMTVWHSERLGQYWSLLFFTLWRYRRKHWISAPKMTRRWSEVSGTGQIRSLWVIYATSLSLDLLLLRYLLLPVLRAYPFPKISPFLWPQRPSPWSKINPPGNGANLSREWFNGESFNTESKATHATCLAGRLKSAGDLPIWGVSVIGTGSECEIVCAWRSTTSGVSAKSQLRYTNNFILTLHDLAADVYIRAISENVQYCRSIRKYAICCLPSLCALTGYLFCF